MFLGSNVCMAKLTDAVGIVSKSKTFRNGIQASVGIAYAGSDVIFLCVWSTSRTHIF